MTVDVEVLDLVSSSSSEENVSPSEHRASTVETSDDEARSNASRGTTTVTVTASGRAGEGGGKDGDASVSTPVDAVAVRARVNAMTTRGTVGERERHLEAFDDALEEDASNFKEARGRVGSTRYEALREWVTRDVEGYDEMRDEHKAMDARLRRAWNEFPEKRREPC